MTRTCNKILRLLPSTLLLVAFLSGCTPPAIPDRAAGGEIIAFVNAELIPMDRERILSGHSVLVKDGRIIEIGPAAKVKVPTGATTVDASGKFLLPAFCDMHVHLLSEPWGMMFPPEARLAAKGIDQGEFLFPYIANGVTTLQVMSATPDQIALRDRIQRGELLGPRLLLSRMVDGPKRAWPPPLSTWVANAKEARQMVLDAKKTGYDSIKVYSFLSPEAYDAITAAAREVKLPVIGHIPMSQSVEKVLAAGQVLIAHSEEVMKHAQGEFGPERIQNFAELLSEKGTWMTPTLVASRAILAIFNNPEGAAARPEARYFRHPLQLGVWSFLINRMYKPIPAEGRKMIHNGFEYFQLPFTLALHKNGGRLLAGTDSLLPGVLPGFALHDELAELTGIGLSPYQALRTSTTAPFDYLGETERAGTVEVGKRGDLVLLGKNPMENIQNTRTIMGVLVSGRWIPGGEIRKRMDEIAARYAKKP